MGTRPSGEWYGPRNCGGSARHPNLAVPEEQVEQVADQRVPQARRAFVPIVPGLQVAQDLPDRYPVDPFGRERPRDRPPDSIVEGVDDEQPVEVVSPEKSTGDLVVLLLQHGEACLVAAVRRDEEPVAQ